VLDEYASGDRAVPEPVILASFESEAALVSRADNGRPIAPLARTAVTASVTRLYLSTKLTGQIRPAAAAEAMICRP